MNTEKNLNRIYTLTPIQHWKEYKCNYWLLCELLSTKWFSYSTEIFVSILHAFNKCGLHFTQETQNLLFNIYIKKLSV